MKRLRSHTIGVDRGDVMLFSDYEDGGPMWTGWGQTVRQRRVTLLRPFREEPIVQRRPSLRHIASRTVIRATGRA